MAIDWRLSGKPGGRSLIEHGAGGPHARLWKVPFVAVSEADDKPIVDQIDKTRELVLDPLHQQGASRLGECESFRRWFRASGELGELGRERDRLLARKDELAARKRQVAIEAPPGLVKAVAKLDAELANVGQDIAQRQNEIRSGEVLVAETRHVLEADFRVMVRELAMDLHADLERRYAEAVDAMLKAVTPFIAEVLALEWASRRAMASDQLVSILTPLFGEVVPAGDAEAKPLGTVTPAVVIPPAPPAPKPQPPMFPTTHQRQHAEETKPAAEPPATPIPGLLPRKPYIGRPQ